MENSVIQPISAAAAEMIIGFEVSSPEEYIPKPAWPGGASGITIGVGYDLGYASATIIAQDWGALPSTTITRLQSCAGRRAAAASFMLHLLADILVPWPAAEAVYRTCDLPRYAAQALSAFPNSDELSPDSFGALVSLVMNRGCGMADPKGFPGSRLEMRQIRLACINRNFATIPGFIRAMERLWTNGLVERREEEAALFEKGLGIAAPEPPPFSEADILDNEYNQGA